MADIPTQEMTLEDDLPPAELKRSRQKMAENIAKICEGKWDANQLTAILLLALPQGMRQYKMAEYIGVRPQTISEWKTLPGFLRDVNRVAAALFLETHIIVDRANFRDAIRDPTEHPHIAAEIMKSRETFYKRYGLLVDRKELTGADGGPVRVAEEVAPRIDDAAFKRIARDVLDERSEEK